MSAVQLETRLTSIGTSYSLDFVLPGHVIPWASQFSGAFAPFADVTGGQYTQLHVRAAKTLVSPSQVRREFELEVPSADLKARSFGPSVRDIRATMQRVASKAADPIVSTIYARVQGGQVSPVGEAEGVLVDWLLGEPVEIDRQLVTPRDAYYEFDTEYAMVLQYLVEM